LRAKCLNILAIQNAPHGQKSIPEGRAQVVIAWFATCPLTENIFGLERLADDFDRLPRR
jgi:hypothetical protein